MQAHFTPEELERMEQNLQKTYGLRGMLKLPTAKDDDEGVGTGNEVSVQVTDVDQRDGTRPARGRWRVCASGTLHPHEHREQRNALRSERHATQRLAPRPVSIGSSERRLHSSHDPS